MGTLGKIALRILKSVADNSFHSPIIGDIEELFEEKKSKYGSISANIWVWKHVLKSLPVFIKNSIYRSFGMFKSYVKTTLRNIGRHKTFSFINIFGLAIGMASCALLLLFIRGELSFDSFHNNYENIYRPIMNADTDGQQIQQADFPGPAAAEFVALYPEVSNATKLYRWFETKLLKHEDKYFRVTDFVYTDENFFSIFDFPIVNGEKQNLLREPNAIVISEEIAKLFFGEEDPVGLVLQDDIGLDYKIAGVVRANKNNSNIQFDVLASWQLLRWGWANQWGAYIAETYLLLDENTSPANLASKFHQLWDKNVRSQNTKPTLTLQRLKDVHLHSRNISSAFQKNKGNINYIYAFSAIALLIVLIACINSMNLSTARSAKRAREVGMRKVVGARRRQLIYQFIGESTGLALIAMIFAVGLLTVSLPLFSGMSGRAIEIDYAENAVFFIGLGVMTLFVGLISGIYPALFLSGFEPIRAIKGVLKPGDKDMLLRKFLVTLQFSVTIILIVAAAVVYKQLQYVNNTDLGFSKEQIIVSRVSSGELLPVYKTFKSDVQSIASVQNVTISNFVMGEGGVRFSVSKEGGQEGDEFSANVYHFDEDFVPLFDLEVIAGRNISREFGADTSGSVIINENFARRLGFDDPIGKSIRYWDQERKIVGVVKDFHFQSLHNEMKPALLSYDTRWITFNVSMKVQPMDFENTIGQIRKSWGKFFPDRPFDFTFLDDNLNALYFKDRQTGKIIGYFSLIAITIACLGLFGLISFMAEQRTKEIGVRKILGASVENVIILLSREFSILVLIANVIAWPFAYVITKNWLESFAFRIDLGVEVFLFAAASAIFIAGITISFQTFKAAFSNPVEALRYE